MIIKGLNGKLYANNGKKKWVEAWGKWSLVDTWQEITPAQADELEKQGFLRV